MGPSGRGPVFYELVRTTSGGLAVGGAAQLGESHQLVNRDAQAFLTAGGESTSPSGVIEPVVDPNPPEASPPLLLHDPAAALSKVVAIHPRPGGSVDVEIARMPELDAWLHARHDTADLAEPGAEAPAAPVHVALDFAPGTDQFAVALASDGRLLCWRGVVPYVFPRAEARALIDYLNRIDLEPLLDEGTA